DLATWNTTQAVAALAAATGEVGALGCIDWLLAGQHVDRHPFTDAVPGGWGWSDASGAVPDVDDTAGALLALGALRQSASVSRQPAIQTAAQQGIDWLLAMQNRDGGWPTFCRGWGTLPFDRSGPDLTAHALRALRLWRPRLNSPQLRNAIEQGLDYLARTQRPDGSWVPLWFGNQHHPAEENPVYGTARVLLAYRDLGQTRSAAARRGIRWLATSGFSGGGWGCGLPDRGEPSVEETALAVEALLSAGGERGVEEPLGDGLQWLVDAVETGHHHQPAPIGFYFARLWYYESLYPLIFTVSALGRAVRQRTDEQ
ncbi:MAG: squalene--hopene cyclase, partial [Pirellulales bacterium]